MILPPHHNTNNSLIETFTLFRYVKQKQWSELFIRQRMNRTSTNQWLRSAIIPCKFSHILNISICIEGRVLCTIQNNTHVYSIAMVEYGCIMILINRFIRWNTKQYISWFLRSRTST